MKLPKTFTEVISQHGISKDDIIFAASADFDMEYRFSISIVALTKDKLLVAAYPLYENAEFRFGGYGSQEIFDDFLLLEKPALCIYEMDRVSKMEVIRQISTGILLAEIDGIERNLCHFSNTKMSDFLQVCKLHGKLKKEEEIVAEDLDAAKGKERCPKCGMIYLDQERKICPKCMNKKSILFRLLSFYKPYKVSLAVLIFCYLGTAAINMMFPYLTGTVLYDRVLGKDEGFLKMLHLPQGNFLLALMVLVFMMIVSQILLHGMRIVQGVVTAKVAPRIIAKLKTRVFASMGELSIGFYTKRQTGGLMTRISNDAEEISSFLIDGVPYFSISFGTLIATIGIMFYLNPLLALAVVVLMLVHYVIERKMLPIYFFYTGKRHRAERKLNAQLNESFVGARVVKAFGQQKQEMKSFSKNSAFLRSAEQDMVRYDHKFFALYKSLQDGILFVVWAIGSALIISGSNMEIGLLITFAGYAAQLKGPLRFMSRVVRWYTNSMNAGQRLFEIIDAVPDVKEAKEPHRPESIKGDIELKNVFFGYEANKPVLKDVSFHVKAGEVLGIVGRSGTGKSTLVNLISRLYDVDEGEILVDGVNVKQYGFKELRKNVAMVSQETYIFMGTVAENIGYARPEATREEIIRAAIQANSHDFICKMPEGYDTMLGSSGRALSGGERQRISIARAILADPKILILDEATSAVDTETELAIQRSLEKLEKGRTVLSIAHRLSTLRNATHLIVLEDGKVTEYGTHQELMELKGTYYKLNELQTKALAMRGIE